MVADALGRFEDRAALLYNLACCEARLGEIEPALGHLEEALAARPSLNELAQGDTDLDALRGEARVGELVGTA
jgi:hypothetical protein